MRQKVKAICRRLGLLRSPDASPEGEEGPDWYDQLYSSSADYHCEYAKSHYYFLWAVIVDRVRRAGVQRILEIGCGPGQLAAFLLDQGVTQYAGVDFSPKAVEIASRQVPRGVFFQGDARDPSVYGRVAYEVIICTEVLEHIEDDLVAVSHFPPGTLCLCSVPNFAYKGHVRHFASAAEVKDRYGRFFDKIDVMTFKSPRWHKDEFFLIEGVRNSVRVGAD